MGVLAAPRTDRSREREHSCDREWYLAERLRNNNFAILTRMTRQFDHADTCDRPEPARDRCRRDLRL
jgi:hypothetical protein